jgi:hypothetical protein
MTQTRAFRVLFTLVIFLWCFSPALAQPTRPEAPVGVAASDGDHVNYILVRWEAASNAQQYKVFRSTNSKMTSMQEVSKSWQKSTWFCDYGVQKGVDYYYAVMSGSGDQSSNLSNLDKGFVRKTEGQAGNNDLSEAQGLTTSRSTYLLVSNMGTEKNVYRAGDTVALTINLQNIAESITPATQIRVFLSKDVVLDWDDIELSKKAYTSFPANQAIVLREKVVLGKSVMSGFYNLITVISTEGNILTSKTGVCAFKVER